MVCMRMIPDKLQREAYVNSPQEAERRWENRFSKGTKFFPKHWLIEFTNYCGKRCRYCCKYEQLTDDDYAFMSRELFNKFKKYLAHASSICIAGVGEPLCHPDFIQWVDEIRSINKTATLLLFTNAQIPFSYRLLQTFIRNEMYVYMSFDSMEKTVYEELRQGCLFDMIVDNFEYMDNIKKIEESVYPIVITSMVVSQITLPDVLRTMEFVAPWCQGVYMNELFYDDSSSSFLKHRVVLSDEQVQGFIETGERLGLRLEGIPILRYQKQLLNVCYDPMLTIGVNAKGIVNNCLHCGKSIGSLQKDSFSHVWNHQRFKNFVSPTCKSCAERNTWAIL